MKKNITSMICAAMMLPLTGMAQIDSAPSDAAATQAVKNLYAYLKDDVWGKKVLSGCQAQWDYNISDASAINKAAGKYPAINVFDFQHYGQSWINYKSSIAKDWHDNHGIVGFMWHWNMPSNAFTEAKSSFYSFYAPDANSSYSNMSPGRAATDGTLENRIAKKWMDGVADCLLLYQEQGIPVLWRPLHEAAGNYNGGGKAWFWWGNDGPDGFKKLYIYMHDYFQAKGIHNLIYVWTSQLNDADWYPGDGYVDIVARDAYPKNYSHESLKADFNTLKTRYPNKMIALAECDGVPSIENMVADSAMWLYVAPWTGDYTFGYNNDNTFWTNFLGSSDIISRDEVPQF